ncbi:hypothetical protein FHT87_000516 [Rhizobium sp. BK316]|uniref:hypothetical protein n=1 Tax=Rhizobium sp. BK316 TaxID=2587053 RepID=UPI00161CD586|nr:hypothetical protein [Rhizobium sp. BK316]MBB3406616.1 hypothetical protein [Rhizobium sp. BK316]
MGTFVVDDGEFYVLFERSFNDQAPHHRTLPDDAPASTGKMPSFRRASHSAGMVFPASTSADVAFRHVLPWRYTSDREPSSQ